MYIGPNLVFIENYVVLDFFTLIFMELVKSTILIIGKLKTTIGFISRTHFIQKWFDHKIR